MECKERPYEDSEISHLSKVYGKDNTLVKALTMFFSVEKGEFVAITGPSGSGKSTFCIFLGGGTSRQKGALSSMERIFPNWMRRRLLFFEGVRLA